MRYWAIIGVGAMLALSMSLISTVLTGRTEVRPLPFEYGPLEEKGGQIQRELDRLYTRYDDRLASLSSLIVTARPNSLAVESAASKIAGVRTATRISFDDGAGDLHLEIRRTGDGELPFDPERFPRPILTDVSPGSGLPDANVRKIDAALLDEEVGSSGWIRNGDGTLYRWTKLRSHSLILIGIDTLSVTKLTDGWLAESPGVSGDFSSILASSGAASVRLVGPDGNAIEQIGEDVPFGSELGALSCIDSIWDLVGRGRWKEHHGTRSQLALVFRGAGYRTGIVGRFHFCRDGFAACEPHRAPARELCEPGVSRASNADHEHDAQRRPRP